MRYICQRDYDNIPYTTFTSDPDNEEGKHTTIKTSGCGLCASIMVLDRLLTDYKFDLEDAIELSYASKANTESGTNYTQYAPAFAEKFNLRFKKSSNIVEVAECLRTGGAAVAHVLHTEEYSSVFTTWGHYIAIVSVDEKGIFTILDPDQYEGKFDGDNCKYKARNDGHFIYATPELLVAETQKWPTFKYFLFWRKSPESLR